MSLTSSVVEMNRARGYLKGSLATQNGALTTKPVHTIVLAAEISLQRSSPAGSHTTGKATPKDCESHRAESSADLGSDETQPP